MKSILFMLLFLPVSLAAQMSSPDYSSPATGVASSGGFLRSTDYAASGTVMWYDCSPISSNDYRGSGIGNAEVANRSITSVEEDTIAGNGVKVSPNPLTELSMLTITLELGMTIRLTLFDVTGMELYAETFDNRGAGKHVFSLGSFTGNVTHAGVYLLKIDTGDTIEVVKIMKF